MTDLNRNVRRRTNTLSHAGRRLVLEIRPGAIDTVFVKEEGRRLGYTVPLARIFQLGARLEADNQRKIKADKRKAKKHDKKH